MAGSTTAEMYGFEFRIRPKSWWRRHLPFSNALFFENWGTSFVLEVKRQRLPFEGETITQNLKIFGHRPDGKYSRFANYPTLEQIEKLPVGDKGRCAIEGVSSPPGRMALCLEMPPNEDGSKAWKELFWYQVRPEEDQLRWVGYLILLFFFGVGLEGAHLVLGWLIH